MRHMSHGVSWRPQNEISFSNGLCRFGRVEIEGVP